MEHSTPGIRRAILFTLLILLCLLLGGLALVFMAQENYPQGQAFSVLADDGHTLHGTYYPGTSLRLLWIGDENLDRYGNQGAVQFHTGLLMAQYFAARPESFLHYDQRNDASVLRLARDARQVIQLQGPVDVILAHGQGCYTALTAAQELKPQPKAIVLFSCESAQSYLAYRMQLLLQRMENAGAPARILKLAHQYIRAWEAAGFALEPLPADAEPGLRLLHNSLERETTTLGQDGLKENRSVVWDRTLSSVLQRKIQVFHFRAEHDAFTPAAAPLIDQSQPLTPGLHQAQLAGADYFLRRASRREVSQLELALAALRADLAPSVEAALSALLQQLTGPTGLQP